MQVGLGIIDPSRRASTQLSDMAFFPKTPYPLGDVVDDSRHGAGGSVPLAAAVKKATAIPVFTIGRLDVELGEEILRSGKADFISFNRLLMAVPGLPNKLAEGRPEDFRPCTGCTTCFDNLEHGNPPLCQVNAPLGREKEYEIKPAKMMATRCARPGQVLLHPEFVERAKELGHNLVEAMNTPYDEVKWLGEEGWCPVCHSNLMLQGEPHWDGTSYEIECAMCGAGGSLAVENGNARFVVAADGLTHCRIFTEGRYNHLLEITETHKRAFQNIETIRSLSKRYKKFKLPGI